MKNNYYQVLKWKVKLKINSYLENVHYFYDRKLDQKVCQCDLTKYVPSIYRESKGATGSQATHYRILDEIFKDIVFTNSDSLIDIGCGKGRILAYLLLNQFPGKLTGIELNEEVAAIPQTWAAQYENVEIIAGDAFTFDLTKYNYFFLGRPFETPFFLKFLKKFEQEIQKPITLIYWVDQVNGHFLDERPGWEMLKRDKIHYLKVLDCFPVPLAAVGCPQRYSIWEYNPELRKDYNGPIYDEVSNCSDYSLLEDVQVDIEYCNKYDVSFDRTITGRIIWKSKKWDKKFDSSRCLKDNSE